MVVKYQCLEAPNAQTMSRLVGHMDAKGYVAVGPIICGTRRETIEHTIKGATTVHQTYLRQSFWYAPNVDSVFADCIKQHNLLTQIVQNANIPYQEYPEHVEIDRDIIEVIEEHLRGDVE